MEGDRIVVEPLLPCGFCKYCIQGEYNTCVGHGRVSCPIDVPPTALWGAYADYMYLDPHSVVHRIGASVPPDLAALYNALGSGIHWAVHRPGTTLGDTIVILGCGQRGLCSVIAAREAGASCIVVTGLRRDDHRLKLARELGAHHTILADQEDTVEAVLRSLPHGADVVLDTTPGSPRSVNDAVEIVARHGTTAIRSSCVATALGSRGCCRRSAPAAWSWPTRSARDSSSPSRRTASCRRSRSACWEAACSCPRSIPGGAASGPRWSRPRTGGASS